jgi:hypothetical protein
MITAGLLAVVLCVVLAVILLLAGRAGTAGRLFVQVSWIPSVALLWEYLLSDTLARHLSYAAVLIPILTCVASFVLTVIGATFIASARQHHEDHSALLYATIIAAVPGALLTGYILFSVATHVIHSGA